MRITKNNIPCTIPESVSCAPIHERAKRLSRYMLTLVGWAGDSQYKNCMYFLKRGQTYSISTSGSFWVFDLK